MNNLNSLATQKTSTEYVVVSNGIQYQVDYSTAKSYLQIIKQVESRTSKLELLKKSDSWAELIGDRNGEPSFEVAQYAFSCAQSALEDLIDEDLKTLNHLLEKAVRVYGKADRVLATRTEIEREDS